MKSRPPRQAGIYAITNIVNGKQYVGQSHDIKLRWHGHQSLLRRGKSHSKHLQNAWDKYGKDSFTLEIIEVVTDLAALNERERYWIDALQPAYTSRADPVTNCGITHSPESIARMLAGRKAKWGYIVTSETRAKLSAAGKGRKQSPEHRNRRLTSVAKRMLDPEVREKIAVSKRGKKRPPEMVHRIALKLTGRKVTGQALENVRLAARERSGIHNPAFANPGERNGNHKLTWEQVREIRRLYAGGVVQTALAKQFGVAQGIISSIVRGVMWKEGDA